MWNWGRSGCDWSARRWDYQRREYEKSIGRHVEIWITPGGGHTSGRMIGMLAAMSPSLAAPEPARERAGRGRDDACPGALRLHAADDGALARIRVPGGLLTAEQALALATAAEELGDGALETTSRGNVQLRGLAADAGAELAARLTEAALLPSLSHDRVRNIVATPLAGLDGGTDLRPWLRELDALLCASDTARALSGRFLFALDDGRGDVAALDADVTLIARPDGSALVRLGRADWCAEAVDGPRAALRAAEAFVALADGAWRVREADPDGARLAARLGLTPRPLPELIGRRPVVGVQAGALGAGLRFGRATADQWRALAGAASAAANELRVTPGAPSSCPVPTWPCCPASPRSACAPTPLALGGRHRLHGRPRLRQVARRCARRRGRGAGGHPRTRCPARPLVRLRAPLRPPRRRLGGRARRRTERLPDLPTDRQHNRSDESTDGSGGRRGPEDPVIEYEKDGAAIYRESFATIRAEADLAALPADVAQVAVRMIHACGMTDLVKDLLWTPNVVADARAALRAGAPILCDVSMVASGVTRKRLPADNEVICTLSDPSVPALAAELGTTRSAAAMELWRDRLAGSVVAVGNAPTSLFRLLEMIEDGAPARPR